MNTKCRIVRYNKCIEEKTIKMRPVIVIICIASLTEVYFVLFIGMNQ